MHIYLPGKFCVVNLGGARDDENEQNKRWWTLPTIQVIIFAEWGGGALLGPTVSRKSSDHPFSYRHRTNLQQFWEQNMLDYFIIEFVLCHTPIQHMHEVCRSATIYYQRSNVRKTKMVQTSSSFVIKNARRLHYHSSLNKKINRAWNILSDELKQQSLTLFQFKSLLYAYYDTVLNITYDPDTLGKKWADIKCIKFVLQTIFADISPWLINQIECQSLQYMNQPLSTFEAILSSLGNQ